MAQVDYFNEHTETPVEGKHFADWAFEEQEVFKIFQPSESQAGVKLSHYVESHRTQVLSCLAETLWCKSARHMSVFTVDVSTLMRNDMTAVKVWKWIIHSKV